MSAGLKVGIAPKVRDQRRVIGVSMPRASR
jgi:hypothetical protein